MNFDAVPSHTAASRRLPDGHTAPLLAADQFFGGFCVFMTVVALIAWSRGEARWTTPAAIFAYLAANFVCSRLLTSRSANPARAELIRLAIMTAANPIVFFATDGPLAQWWPGFLINALGQGIVLGLITQRAVWGTVIALYYVGLYAACAMIAPRSPDPYLFALVIGVIAMVSLLWARIMSLLGTALHNEHDRTVQLAKARDALSNELEIAVQIQTLLRPREPRMPGYIVHGCTVAADEVAGDYYDVLETASGRRFVTIGDVAGHGVTSGLAMMMARASLLGALEARPEAPMTEIYIALNRGLHANLRRMGVDLYMTFTLLELEPDGGFCAVGRHLPLMVHRRGAGTVEQIEVAGPWLGIVPDLAVADVPEMRFSLAPGDTLVLLTDGVTDALEPEDADARLGDLIRDHARSGPAALVTAIMSAASVAGGPRDDDMTLLVIERAAPPTAQ